ncbi:unnamed protein product, partial [Acanthocheilonema viteae]
NAFPAPHFLSSTETYEKYERSHNRDSGHMPVSASGVTPVTYLNEYKVVTRTPVPPEEVMVPLPKEQIISKQNMQPFIKKQS